FRWCLHPRFTSKCGIALPIKFAAASSAKQVRKDSRITEFLCPQRQRNRREIVRLRHCISVLRQINRSQMMLAGVARFHSNVRELFRHVHRQLVLSLFAARRTQNSAERPLVSAKSAPQPALAAVALWP